MKSFWKWIGDFAFWVALLGGIAIMCGIFFLSARDAHREMKEDARWRETLIQASKKSDAHEYFVSNWLQCRPIFTTRAECLASIRTAAGARGAEFVHRIDAVAIELGLV